MQGLERVVLEWELVAKGMELEYVPLVIQEGKLMVQLYEADIEMGDEIWRNDIILCFRQQTIYWGNNAAHFDRMKLCVQTKGISSQ